MFFGWVGIFLVSVLLTACGGGGSAGGGGEEDGSGTTALPDAPSVTTALPVSESAIDLSWNDNSDNETGFRIEQSTRPDSGFQQIAVAPADTVAFSITNLDASTTYYYRLLAYNDQGNSNYSNIISARTQDPLGQFSLVVEKSTTGFGEVIQPDPVDGEAINCGEKCSAVFAEGDTITLVARIVYPGSRFRYWLGCDTVDASGVICTVSMDRARTVFASFEGSITLSSPASTDGNGEYFLRWQCDGICPILLSNSYYVIEEDVDERFLAPNRYVVEQNRTFPLIGAYFFSGKEDGYYCYRVSFHEWQNWGQERCVWVRRTPVTLPKTAQGNDSRDKGIIWPDPRFSDNQDGTITDNLTGLMWLADTNCIADRYPSVDNFDVAGDGAVNWRTALEFISDINAGRYPDCASIYRDWRLPNVNELLSLDNPGAIEPLQWLRSQGFLNLGFQWGYRWYYWSSTTSLRAPHRALAVNTGVTEQISKAGDPAYPTRVWPVRASAAAKRTVWQTGQDGCFDESGNTIACAGDGQDGEIRAGVVWPSPRFKLNSGTVIDNLTGLVWLADADCLNTHYPALSEPSSPDGTVSWEEAISFVNGINIGDYPECAAGHNDWRLPNINELRSLMDFGVLLSDRANEIGISNLQTHFGYWSSTTSSAGGQELFARVVFVASGSIGSFLKNEPSRRYHIWPVRSEE